QQAGGHRMRRIAEELRERVPRVRREADAERFRGLAGDAATFQVLDRRLRLAQLLAEEALSAGERVERTFEHRAVRRVAAFARDFHSSDPRELLDGFGKRQAVVFHQKRDDGPVLAAAEAVEELLVWRHRERRRLLVVERAERVILAARTLELDARADDVDDVGPREQVLDERIGNAGHAPLAYPSFALIRPDSLPISVRPATLGLSQPITLPMSLMPAAPVSAIACPISAATSASPSCCGR